MALDSQIHTMTATELADAYTLRELSPVDASEALLERIEILDPAVNAFCHLDPEDTLAQARASESRHVAGQARGPLDGVPVAIKDLFATRGWPMLRGSRLTDPDQDWTYEAPSVARLREAGAVLIGKTTTPEFGWKGLTDNPLTGITRNPWDLSKTPGGSSGGSAAALASGMAPLALGTDGGGSIRIPGAFTGVVGLKPTFGRVPNAPMSPFGTVAHAGPMARTVADANLLFRTLAVYDVKDWTALPDRAVESEPETSVAGLRVMFSLTLGHVEVDPEVSALVTQAAEILSSLGADVIAADPGIADARSIWETLWYAGAAALVAGLDPERLDEVDAGLIEIAAAGRELSALDYLAAFSRRVDLAVAFGRTLSDYDLLVTPTIPIPAFQAGAEVPPGWPERRWQSWSPFSLPFNLSQQPAATVPCGLTKEGLPVGLQIVAAKHRDDLVWRAAAAYEAARSHGNDMFMRPVENERPL
jgi:aspartyl-tRNA(Asn)/glutamyl-tRNA(Gln) amidotransferase subunit A